MVTSTYNDKKDLRKGEKLMVYLEDVLHDTLLVILEHRGMKFCGALLNTSKRLFFVLSIFNSFKMIFMKFVFLTTVVCISFFAINYLKTAVELI